MSRTKGAGAIGTVVTTTKRTYRKGVGEGYDPRPDLERAWVDVANMEPGVAMAAAFKIRGIETVDLAQIIRGETAKVHSCRPGDPTPEEFENFVVTRWGPGKYELAPIYRGFKLRRRSWLIGGTAAADPNGPANDTGAGENVDRVIAEHVKRKSAMVVLREISELEQKGKDSSTEDADVNQANSMMLELLKLERDRSARMEDRIDRMLSDLRAPTPATAPVAPAFSLETIVPIALSAAAKLPGPLQSKILTRIMGIVAPAEAVPAGGWTPDAVNSIIQAGLPILAQIGPMLQGVLAALVPNAAGHAATAPPTIIEQPAQPQPAGVTPMPILLTAEGKLALEIALEAIRQEDYETAWEALGTSQDTIPYVVNINPNAKPIAYLPLWLGWLGQELFTQLRGSVIAFIQWSQAHKAELDRESDDDETPGGGDGSQPS